MGLQKETVKSSVTTVKDNKIPRIVQLKRNRIIQGTAGELHLFTATIKRRENSFSSQSVKFFAARTKQDFQGRPFFLTIPQCFQ